MPKTLAHRYRRKMAGGLMTMRVYTDGTAKVRFDHPSNDPEIEMSVVGLIVKVARELFARNGYDLKVGPIAWNDDPPPSPSPTKSSGSTAS